MNALPAFAGFSLILSLVSCATPPRPPASSAASATDPAMAGSVAATSPEPSRAVAPSLEDTKRLDRELGNAVVPYPFDHCAVIQKPFDGDGPKHRRIYQGHEVLFCCTPCVRAFDANPEPFMPRIVAAAKDREAGTVTPPVATP